MFFNPKNDVHTGNKRLLWQHLTAMVIDKIRKMSVKGVKLKSESYFSISPEVLELWRKNLRVKVIHSTWKITTQIKLDIT